MQEVHFHGRRSEGHRSLRGHARSTVLDTQTVVNSLPLSAEDVPFRVVLTGAYNHTEQALVQRLHVANPVHIREALAFLRHVGHVLYAGLIHPFVLSSQHSLLCADIELDQNWNERVEAASRAAVVFTRDPSSASNSSSSSTTTSSSAADQPPADDATDENRDAVDEERRLDEPDRVHVPQCDVDGPRIVRFADVSPANPRPGEHIELASTVIRRLRQEPMARVDNASAAIRQLQDQPAHHVLASNRQHNDFSNPVWLFRAFSLLWPYGRGHFLEPRAVPLSAKELLQHLVRVSTGQFRHWRFVLAAYDWLSK